MQFINFFPLLMLPRGTVVGKQQATVYLVIVKNCSIVIFFVKQDYLQLLKGSKLAYKIKFELKH